MKRLMKIGIGLLAIVLAGILVLIDWREVRGFQPLEKGDVGYEVEVVIELQPGKQKLYRLRDRWGGEIEAFQLETFVDLEYTWLDRGDEHFLVLRYLGTGSANAYNYSVFRVGSEGALAGISMSKMLDWHLDDADACRDDPRVAELDAPQYLFTDCNGPTLINDELVFEMPGWHCAMFTTGGCRLVQHVQLDRG